MTVFESVKKAVAQAPEVILAELGVNLETKIRNEWTQCRCPLCDDRSGSASITARGFLHCHQCSSNLDLFEWVSLKTHEPIHEIAIRLAERLKVEITKPPAQKHSGQMPARMTEEVLTHAINDLWTADQASQARKFLAERKLDGDPEFLGELGVGFARGYIVFAQRDHNGKIQDRYRGYLPGGTIKWQWFGKGSGGPGIWQGHRPVQATTKVLMLEGEWDVLTAYLRLQLHEAGWSVATWTAGASSSPKLHDIPKAWYNHEVHICYDNDVFQGIAYDKYWVKDKSQRKLEQLRRNLLTKVAPTFAEAQCDVIIRQIPIPAVELWGADFRDWVNRGGINLADLPAFPLDKIPSLTNPIEQLDFDELWDGHLGQRVSSRMQVSAIGGDDLIFPTTCMLKCQLGQLACCSTCRAPKEFADGFIPTEEYQQELSIGLAEDDLEAYVLKHIVKRPKSCPEARIVVVEGKPASHWAATRTGGDDTRQRTLHVISTQPPSLSGEVDVSGVLHSHGNGLLMFADHVNQLDRAEVDLGSIQGDLRRHCPVNAESVEVIDEYLDTRWKDISKHATRVFGRRDIYVACELLFHSVIGIMVSGKVRRGWLDIAILGDTRTGKSMTINNLIKWYQLGGMVSAVDNVSRAGLVMGADGKGMMKPGLLTKSHKKLLAMDEFHWLVNKRSMGDDHPMSWLQSARDEGKVYGVKIYGDRALPAKVRLITISNWARSSRRSHAYPCEHFGWVYGSPETLSRLDFGLVVEGPPSSDEFDDVPEVFNLELARSLVLRAWAQDANQVIVRPESEALAFEYAASWKHKFTSEKLPLYTPEEKPYSLLRIATAVANLCFSHVPGDPYSVVVNTVHVEWAAAWLLHVWEASGYDQFSRSALRNDTEDSPFAIERFLMVNLRLDDPAHASRVLDAFMHGFDSHDDCAMLGLISEDDKRSFISKGTRLNVLTHGGGDRRGMFVMTDIAHRVAMQLKQLSLDDPDEFVTRYRKLVSWTRADSGPEGLVPLEA